MDRPWMIEKKFLSLTEKTRHCLLFLTLSWTTTSLKPFPSHSLSINSVVSCRQRLYFSYFSSLSPPLLSSTSPTNLILLSVYHRFEKTVKRGKITPLLWWPDIERFLGGGERGEERYTQIFMYISHTLLSTQGIFDTILHILLLT